MSDVVISAENISKSYQLGVIGTGTFRGDLQRWWANVRGLPDPHLKVGEKDHGNREGDTVWALKNISFEVRRGEVLGIIGRNGAGKSTLLKILSRVTAPTTGEIRVRGRIASLLEVGTGFHPELTGRENIFLNGAILGMNRHEITRKFDEIVDFSGVEKYIDTPVKRYSSGMYVRLAFAVAAHLEPEILVVDEVLAVGDAEFQKKCLGKMGDVAREGRTVLFVSHNMPSIQNLCNRGFCLDGGQIRYEGDISDVVEIYLNSSVEQDVWERDASNMQRRTGEGTRFKFLKVRLDVKNKLIRMWEPLSFEIDFGSTDGAVEVCPGFSIFSADGTCVFTCEGEDDQFLLNLKPGETGRMYVMIPHPALVPGRYTLRMGARSNAQMLDWIDKVLHFEVSPIGSSLWADRKTLGMRPRSEWKKISSEEVKA
jgi:lipopolysaccharide transport system ATP-binding protein